MTLQQELECWKSIAGRNDKIADSMQREIDRLKKENDELRAIVYGKREARPEIQQNGNLYQINFKGR